MKDGRTLDRWDLEQGFGVDLELILALLDEIRIHDPKELVPWESRQFDGGEGLLDLAVELLKVREGTVDVPALLVEANLHAEDGVREHKVALVLKAGDVDHVVAAGRRNGLKLVFQVFEGELLDALGRELAVAVGPCSPGADGLCFRWRGSGSFHAIEGADLG